MQNRLVTIFGGGGFLGRYVCEELLRAGYRIRVAQRDPSNAVGIKPLGGLGQTQFVACDITKKVSALRAARGSDAIVNLCGAFADRGEEVNRDGAGYIAEAAAEIGARALVHVSAIGADPESESIYGQTKGEGEQRVMKAFPNATIMRPSIIFGPDDNFLNRFANLIRLSPMVPVIGAKTKFQPVFAGDVAAAIRVAVSEPFSHQGKSYELGGPERLSMLELNRWIAQEIGAERLFIEVPHLAAFALTLGTRWLPHPPITEDQLTMLNRDNVVAEGAQGLRELGVEPTPLAAVAPDYLVKYRRHGRFGRKPRTA
ncbi:complex I NDUFA9 subunit family protein [Novosphingopyxis sp.]|uniref:complex I NDUFA9 subunit family protein n=1 Tax=Novosphingopyxis sp. TaxID=2709690 RepID=UPI003B590F85